MKSELLKNGQLVLVFLFFLCMGSFADVLWSLDSTDQSLWSDRPTWLSNSARHYRVEQIEGVRFSVDELGMGMKWAYYPNFELAQQEQIFLTMLYRAKNIPVWNDYAILMSHQNQEVKINLTQIIDDGCWHRITVEVEQLDTVAMVAVQVQVNSAGGFLEIKELSLSSQKPEKKLSEKIEISGGWGDTGGFSFVDISVNRTVEGWFEAAEYSDPFTQTQITASNIPFKLSGNPLGLLETNISAPGFVDIPFSSAAQTIYMLIGAVFDGDETPSMGWGVRNRIKQPQQFGVEVHYFDQTVDKLFPARLETDINCISEGVGVYYINPQPGKVITNIKLTDNIRNGSLGLFALSSGSLHTPQTTPYQPINVPMPQTSALGEPVETDRLLIRYDSQGNLYSVYNKITQRQWLNSQAKLYDIDYEGSFLTGNLTAEGLESGDISLRLALTNNTESDIECTIKFPVLTNLNPGGDAAKLAYCYPGRTPIINNQNISVKSNYSGYFPFQFLNAYHPDAGGIYINANDQNNRKKAFWLDKNTDIEIGCEYLEVVIKANQTIELPQAIIGAHSGSWHNAASAYRESLSRWYKPAVARKQWFREVFNFREQFLHFGWPLETGAFNKETKQLSLSEMVADDIEAFGGVDYLHIFDWTWTPAHGRVGDYMPWDYLGGHEQFRDEIKKLQDRAIPVGLYFEGYLASPTSMVGRLFGDKWQLINSGGVPYTQFGSSYHMCPAVPQWQDHLVCSILKTAELLKADGYYVDQFGFSQQYRCYNPAHGHSIPTDSVLTELEVTKRLRVESNLPNNAVIYTEAVPTDVTSQYQDGSFTTAVRQGRFHGVYGYLNIARFILPDFKIFEILVVDKPTGDDFEGVKLVFYNGQGLWLMGTASEWYSPEVCELITKTHGILRQYRKAFTSDNPVPLVPTLNSQVYSNYFPADNEQVWTFFNSGYEHIRSDVIEVEHSAGAAYYDVWNDRALWPQIIGDKAVISLEIEPRGVGCVVRK